MSTQPESAPAATESAPSSAPEASAPSTNGNITSLFQDLYGGDEPKTVNPVTPGKTQQAQQDTDPDVQTDPQAQAEATEAPAPSQAEAAPADAPAAAAPADVPQWMAPLVQTFSAQQEANTRLQQMFEQQLASQRAMYDQAAQMRQAQAEQARKQAAMQAREAARPKMPDPQVATPQEMFEWSRANAAYEAQIAREDATSAFTERLAAMEQTIQRQQQAIEQARMQEQAQQYDQYLNQTVASLAADTRYPFMRDKDVQVAFLQHWWSMNESARAQGEGKLADPHAVLQSMMNAAKKMVAVSATTGARAAAQASDAAKRDAQSKRGITPTLGGGAGSPSPKAAEQKARELQQLQDTPWFESGALRTG